MSATTEKSLLLEIPESKLEDDKEDFESTSFKMYLCEAKKLIRIALPMMLTNLFAFLILTETVIFCGQLGKYEMDGASLANSLVNVMGISLAVGFCTACDTFFSQIFGSKHRKFLGVMLQRSLLIGLMIPTMLIAIHLNWEPFLVWVGQDVLVARYCNRFLTLFTPGFFFIFLSLILNRYLQNQYYVIFPLISSVIANIFNITFLYVFVIYLGYGLDAAAIVQACTYLLNFIIQLLFILISGLYKKNWTGISKESLLEWGKFFNLASSGMAMLFFDVFSWEICTFLSGILGPVSLGAQTIMFHYETSLFQACFALGVAVNIRVGEALGANNYKRALSTFRCGIIIAVIYGVLAITFVLSLSKYAAMVFTNEIDIQELTVESFPFMMGALAFDFIHSINCGALRGCGRQKLGLLFVLFGYYLLGQPIGVTLGFATPMGIKGIWTGLTVSMCILSSTAFLYINFFQDWKKQADIAQERIQSSLRIEEEDKEITKSFIIESSLKHHKKTSSTSFIPNTEPQGKLRVQPIILSDTDFIKIYVKRSLSYGVVVLILLAGVLVKCNLKLPSIPMNNTTSSIPIRIGN